MNFPGNPFGDPYITETWSEIMIDKNNLFERVAILYLIILMVLRNA